MISHGLTHYILWCWKGDYYNLGVGTEFGLYYALREKALHWNTVYSGYYLSVDMTISIKDSQGNEKVVYPINPGDKPPDNWWVCTFLPEYQAVDVKDVSVLAEIRFHKDGMIDDFASDSEVINDWRMSIANGKAIFDWPAKNSLP